MSDHHAIIVTNQIQHYQPQKLTPKENNVLKLIMIRMLTALSDKKLYDETKLEITMDNQKDIFKATGRMIVDEGWTLVERTLSAPVSYTHLYAGSVPL